MKTKELTIDHRTYLIRNITKAGDWAHVDIEVYHYYGESDSKEYRRIGATSSMDTTSDLVSAQRVLSGGIKWDGCSDLQFFPDEQGNEHFCGRDHAVDLGRIVYECYEFAKEILGKKVSDDELFYG